MRWRMNRPISNLGERDEKKPALTSVEESAEASSDGRPGKVSLVGGTTAGGQIRAIGSIRKDSNQGGIQIFRLVG